MLHDVPLFPFRRGSMVRTSVFSWQTFPDLRLIYGRHVTTLCGSVRYGSTNRPTQPSIPSGSVNK